MDVVNKTATDPTSASASTNTNNNAGSSESSKITCEMSSEEILTQLANHGCKNITSRLDFTKCHQTPVFTGGFGDVYMGYLKSGDLVALKCSRLRVDTSEKKKQLKRSAHELYIWSKCRHSNILPLIGVAHYKDQLTMISPWMAYGSLTAYLTQHPEADRYDMCGQIAEGVAYLHEQGIVHGDIKGANIMVSKEHVPKIADFGTSVLRDYTLQFATTTKEQINTLRWAAPEVFKGITKLSTKGDVYSLGMVSSKAILRQAA
ncbi:unnamed protein product [Rhizoctonia solani]|uniref:Protein kinase domain-containing protein n=1 Tax=Rhizoctonia solani TaxID=456999 RepID=A0A8H3DLC7_9AGAM|nr:unnamed protein product [Rhizoctonia solani]